MELVTRPDATVLLLAIARDYSVRSDYFECRSFGLIDYDYCFTVNF